MTEPSRPGSVGGGLALGIGCTVLLGAAWLVVTLGVLLGLDDPRYETPVGFFVVVFSLGLLAWLVAGWLAARRVMRPGRGWSAVIVTGALGALGVVCAFLGLVILSP